MRRRGGLLVVDPSVAWPEDEGVATVLSGWDGDAAVLRPALSPGDGPAPPTGHEFGGVVILGSRASVHDPLPWLQDLAAWLAPILSGRIPLPLLGICFGHQLIAQLAGGKVGPTPPGGEPDLGVRETILEKGRLVPETTRLRVVVSHREQVTVLPRGYRVIARRDGVPVDGFEHPSLPIFGFQFHPEARASFLSARGANPADLDAEAVEGNDRLLAAFRRLV